MVMGRPTKYNQDIVDKAYNYVISGYENLGQVVPTIEGMSEVIGIRVSTIYEWEKHEEKEDFSEVLCLLRARQARITINGGLTGDLNSVMSKLLLTKHGYSDKVETDNTSHVTGNVSLTAKDDEILKTALDNLNKKRNN